MSTWWKFFLLYFHFQFCDSMFREDTLTAEFGTDVVSMVTLLQSVPVRSSIECGILCYDHGNCYGVNFIKGTHGNHGNCELLGDVTTPAYLEGVPNIIFYSIGK